MPINVRGVKDIINHIENFWLFHGLFSGRAMVIRKMAGKTSTVLARETPESRLLTYKSRFTGKEIMQYGIGELPITLTSSAIWGCSIDPVSWSVRCPSDTKGYQSYTGANSPAISENIPTTTICREDDEVVIEHQIEFTN